MPPMHRGYPLPSREMQNKRPVVTLTVTSEQAKTKVGDALKAFKVGDAYDRGNVWAVSIKYNDKAVMNVLVGKVNAPTAGDAVKAVQESIGKGWKAGEPKLLGFTYSVPIIDANGNTLGNTMIDGRTGDFAAGFSPVHR